MDTFIFNIQRFVYNLHVIPTAPGTTTAPNVQAPVGEVVQQAPQIIDQPVGGGGFLESGGLGMLIVWGLLLVGLYFLMFRPQRKREKKMREMQAAIKAGDNIVTSSGMFGKVIEVGTDAFVVEFGTNRGIRIPVLKSDVVAIREPKLTPPPAAT